MNKTTVSIPAELLPDLEAWGQLTAEVFGKLREKANLVPRGVPEDQTWFWTKEWQAGEREVDEELARGEYEEFDSAEDLIADLHRHVDTETL